jgi:hypothetical protein
METITRIRTSKQAELLASQGLGGGFASNLRSYKDEAKQIGTSLKSGQVSDLLKELSGIENANIYQMEGLVNGGTANDSQGIQGKEIFSKPMQEIRSTLVAAKPQAFGQIVKGFAVLVNYDENTGFDVYEIGECDFIVHSKGILGVSY